jgi:hypothetical protein
MAIQHFVAGKIKIQLQMRPVIERIAKARFHRLRPGLKFFLVRSVSGNQGFADPISPHGSPFIVVARKPQLGDIIKGLVFINFFGIEMAVVINNRQMLSNLLIKFEARLVRDHKAIVNKTHSILHTSLNSK